MRKFLFISSNKNKINEINDLLRNQLKEYKLKLKTPNYWQRKKIKKHLVKDIETGSSYEENAFLKAKFFASLLNSPVLTEDSGFEIKKLNNFPGINSARWNGKSTQNSKNVQIIQKMKTKKVTDRACKYICCLCYFDPVTVFCKIFIDSLDGEVAKSINTESKNGFGYDPIFLVTVNKTQGYMSELTLSEKNSISHRAKCFRQFANWYSRYQKK